MTKAPKTTPRRKGKDGNFATVESFRRNERRKSAVAPRRGAAVKFPQPERTLVPRTALAVRKGSAHPLGATVRDGGINFAVHSRHARELFVILFGTHDGPATDVIRMPGRTGHIRHCFVEGLQEGQLYALRARGVFNPAQGLRFNEAKLLVDPYAKALAGRWNNADNRLLSYDPAAEAKDFTLDCRDDADRVPKCVALSGDFNWNGDRRPDRPMSEWILYEVHPKGFTAHPSSGVSAPGTYLGFIEKIPHLKKLGVNAVELLPVHAKYSEDHLGEKKLSNYWGYNTIGFFAPESSYGSGASPGCEVAEFKTLVKALHKAGIEVILDVVYNHTAEGNELGPTLCFKGLDNPTYYALTGDAAQPRRHYHNPTGCGNSLDFGNPAVVRLAMDSLRYWVQEMHVDGFRFDLATVHGRSGGQAFNPMAAFFQAVEQDPVLSRAKLIAEPWDCAAYEVGNFPVGWSEWNGKFRDTVRRFVKGAGGQLNEIGWRLTGSADVFGTDGRDAAASINFVTCHDGFTLHDLISYDRKHNEANLEENRDGSWDNLSWNCGYEGETGDAGVLELRRRQARNFICLLLLAQGTPMLNGGDEFLRTQGGNNNAYCHDDSIGWFDWSLAERNADFLRFVRMAIALRKRLPLLMGGEFLTGKDGNENLVPDIAWFGPDGGPLAWNDPERRQFAFQLDGFDSEEEGDASAADPVRLLPNAPCRYYMVVNAGAEDEDFKLPPLQRGRAWSRVADTGLPDGEDFLDFGKEVPLERGSGYLAKSRSVVILREKDRAG